MQVLALMQANPRATSHEIAEQLGITRSSASTYIAELRAEKRLPKRGDAEFETLRQPAPKPAPKPFTPKQRPRHEQIILQTMRYSIDTVLQSLYAEQLFLSESDVVELRKKLSV